MWQSKVRGQCCGSWPKLCRQICRYRWVPVQSCPSFHNNPVMTIKTSNNPYLIRLQQLSVHLTSFTFILEMCDYSLAFFPVFVIHMHVIYMWSCVFMFMVVWRSAEDVEDFDSVVLSTEKLNHPTTSRPRVTDRRPRSQIFTSVSTPDTILFFLFWRFNHFVRFLQYLLFICLY